MEMKIRESCLQTGTFIYKPGISVTKQDFHLQSGSLGLQMGFSGYYLPFDFSEIKFKSEDNRVYMRKATCSESDNVIIFELMSKAGYYSLTVYDFIKHLSDKRGAHMDFGLAPLVKMMNDSNNVTPVQCFALQLIFAAKLQIPELKDYWPELVLLP